MVMYVHRYQVMGNGTFPADMLRYDGSYPARQEDVLRIVEHPCEGPLRTRTVELVHIDDRKSWEPTSDRWASFLWWVVKGSHQAERR